MDVHGNSFDFGRCMPKKQNFFGKKFQLLSTPNNLNMLSWGEYKAVINVWSNCAIFYKKYLKTLFFEKFKP